jgi:hypothetical protein
LRLYFVPVPDGEVVDGLVVLVPDAPELLGKVLLPVEPVVPVFELLPEVSLELVPPLVEPDDPVVPEEEPLMPLPVPELVSLEEPEPVLPDVP